MYVIKRNGEQVVYDAKKVINAINKAFIEVDGELKNKTTANNIAVKIGNEIDASTTPMSVETIQDRVEEALMKSSRKDVAKAYIRYRYKKEVARGVKDDFIAPIKEKLTASDV